MPEDYNIPDPYHPNQVDLYLDDAREQALQQLGLADKVERQGLEALTTEEAAQLGQVLAEQYQSLASNVNQQSE